MNTDIFIITKEVNDEPYLYYLQEGYWNVEKISNRKKASGYIVQEVHISNNSGISNISMTNDYFEAWRVIDGQVEDYEKDNPDDTFRFGIEGMEKFLIKISIGHQGIIKYDTSVYWVEQNTELFSIVNSWKTRTIAQAGKLKSARFDEYCSYFLKISSVGKRSFEHKVAFEDRNTVSETLIRLYKKGLEGKDENVRYELEEILEGSIYGCLVDDICSRFDLIENNNF